MSSACCRRRPPDGGDAECGVETRRAQERCDYISNPLGPDSDRWPNNGAPNHLFFATSILRHVCEGQQLAFLVSSMSTRVPSKSVVTDTALPPNYVHAGSKHFRDNTGRTILLRGVNLGGTKQPRGRSSFDPPHDVWPIAENGGESFKGVPFRLDDGSADEHLSRLRAWGFNCVRYPFTWEALEHEGPYVVAPLCCQT